MRRQQTHGNRHPAGPQILKMSLNGLVVIGQVLKAFGIKGEIKIRPFTESMEAFEKSSTLIFEDSSNKVLGVRDHMGSVLVSLQGVDTPEKAGRLSGILVRTDAKNLPPKEEDEYYWFELIGLSVFTVQGIDLGQITHITPTGANDVLHVQGTYGEVLLPLIDDVVLEVILDEGRMIVDPLEGLIPDA